MSLFKSHSIIFLLRSHAEKFVVNCNSFNCILKLSCPLVLVGRGSENELKRRQNKAALASQHPQKIGLASHVQYNFGNEVHLFQKLVSSSVVLLEIFGGSV